MDPVSIAVTAVVSLGLGWLLCGSRHTCKADMDRETVRRLDRARTRAIAMDIWANSPGELQKVRDLEARIIAMASYPENAELHKALVAEWQELRAKHGKVAK